MARAHRRTVTAVPRDVLDPEPITLSALEFDVVWEHFTLGPQPLVLKVPSPGRTHTERAELADEVWSALSARGLGDPRREDTELRDWCTILAEPYVEVDARIWLGHRVRALAAARSGRGVLAVLRPDELTLQPISPAALARAAVALLPNLPAGPGHSVTVPSTALDAAAHAAGSAVDRFAAELRANGVRPDDATALVTMVRDADSLGQFGAAGRDQWGRRTRADRVIGFFDTPRGRYLQVRSTTEHGEAWSTIAPTDQRRLVQQIDQLTEAWSPYASA